MTYRKGSITIPDVLMHRDGPGREFRNGHAPSGVQWIVIGFSLITGLVLALSGGNLFLTSAVMLGILAIVLSMYRVMWGFSIFLGCVLFFDQFSVPGLDPPFTYSIAYFENLKVIYFPNIDAAVINPVELHLLFLVGIWVAVVTVKKEARFVTVPVWGALVLLFSWLGISFVFGIRTGGDFLPALWEVRAFCYFGIVYCLVPQIVRTKQDIIALIWVCIVAIAFKSFQGIERFIRLGFSFQGLPTLTAHEDALFFTTMLLLLMGLAVLKAHRSQRWTLAALSLPLFIGFIVAQRRSAFGAMGIGLFILFLTFSGRYRWRFVKFVIPFVVALGLYLAVFWSSTSSLAIPAQLVKASFTNEREEAGEKFYSNLYRVYERYNLAMTVQRAPVFGIGFGQTFDTPLKLPKISYPLWDYIPHNEILWLIVKTGGVGFFLFFFFLNAYLVRIASVSARSQDPYLRAVCAIVMVTIVGQIFISYFDLQLTFHRNMIYLGTLMGLLPTLEAIEKQ